MLSYKVVYKDIILDLAFLDGADVTAVRGQQIKDIAMIQANVSLDILSPIVEYEDNISELWTYLRTLY